MGELASNSFSGISAMDARAPASAGREPGARSGGTARAQSAVAAYLISCGGTGGHLAPGIALAEELSARGHEVTLLISERPVDARLAAKYPNLRFARIPGAPFSASPGAFAKFLWHQTRGLRVAWQQVRRERPAAVIGFGGFTSAAVILIAAAFGIPVVLHEANRVPGRAVRTMAPLARRVYLPSGIQLSTARAGRVRPVGLPVRSEIRREPREAACAAFGLDPARPVVVVLGGSQGATPLNSWALAAAPELARDGIQLCCVTGAGKGDAETSRYPGPQGADVTVVFIPFCDRMATLLSAADLAVSRAGAGTIAELIRCQTPAMLVPYPHATDNHQEANADFFARQGGGVVIDEAAIDGLTPRVRALLADSRWLAASRESLRSLDRADVRALIADDVEALTQGRDGASGAGPAASSSTPA
jgi:UDP-N-acetylglucosamine--N-acetylmuramyl-(pentapeptide) pyrophosphoryl-undecaprenol N-acetylglucosamine transferase